MAIPAWLSWTDFVVNGLEHGAVVQHVFTAAGSSVMGLRAALLPCFRHLVCIDAAV